MKRKISEFLLYQLAIPISLFVFKLIALTFRFKELKSENLSPFQGKKEIFIYGFQHSQIIPVIYFYRGIKMVSLASTHKDGEIAARGAAAFGISMVRGSSTRGGVAGLIGLKNFVDSGYDAALTVDGPRGPVGKVNNGIIYLAKLTGKKIVPAAFACGYKIRLTSWDRMVIPLPFSKGFFKFGDPIEVPPDLKDEDIEPIKARITEGLAKINKECEEAADGRAKSNS